jgi:hypothetical protein
MLSRAASAAQSDAESTDPTSDHAPVKTSGRVVVSSPLQLESVGAADD